MSLGKLSMDKYTPSFPVSCLAEECAFELNWRRGSPWIYYILNLAGDEIWFLLTRKRFIWSNKPIMSDLFCIQPPYSFYSGTQRRLCEVTSQAAGHNGLCTMIHLLNLHLDTCSFQMDRITNAYFKSIFWTINDNTLFRCKVRRKCSW